MGDEIEPGIQMRHSFCISQASQPALATCSDNCCKSEINVLSERRTTGPARNYSRRENIANELRSLGDYYKKYEHDEVPVKDSSLDVVPRERKKGSLTNSELDEIERKIFNNMSEELQTENSSLTSLESNIKFFKTTVQEIFHNFYACMKDFELYKNRFNEILAKNQEDAVADMEDFIKDMIHHIMSSESSITNDSRKSLEAKKSSNSKTTDSCSLATNDENSCKRNVSCTNNHEKVVQTATLSSSETMSIHPVVEAYKNDEYLTDSTIEDNKNITSLKKEEVFNIYLLSGNPCVQIKMNDRHLLSEINIKKPSPAMHGKFVASAENMRKLAAKKMELERYVEQEQPDGDVPDIDIPVKESYAKKNIHLDEDFTQEREPEKSLISKICSFLCRKLRKS